MIKTATVVGELYTHHRILTRLRQALDERQFALVVLFPTRSLLDQIQDELLSQPDLAGYGGVRFLLFEGFIEEISERLGVYRRTPSPLERELLISEVFRELAAAGRLDYLSRAPFNSGYRAAILGGIAEWKRAGLTPELFAEWAEERGVRERQLALVFETYQRLLIQYGFTEEDQILAELERMGPGTLTPRIPVLLYGFTDLTPLQSDFIKALQPWCEFEAMVDPTTAPPFQKMTAAHFPIRLRPGQYREEGNRTLTQLQARFWRDSEPEPLGWDGESVLLLRAGGRLRQAVAIARAISGLMRDQPDLEPGAILILAPQPQQFLETAGPVFREYGIALPSPAPSLRELPGAKRLLQMLTAATGDWQWADMTVLVRQWHTGAAAADGDLLLTWLGENYGALSGKERWLRLKDDPQVLQGTMNAGVVSLERFWHGLEQLAAIPGRAALSAYLKLFREWFRMTEAWGEGLPDPNPEVFRKQLQNYRAAQAFGDALEEALAHLARTGHDAVMPLEAIRPFLEDYLCNIEIGEPRGPEALVRVIPPREARGLRAPIVFITGLEQGVFPRSYINDWKLGLKERRDLRGIGIELETGEQYRLQEMLAFYWALRTARRRLYFVVRDQDDDGQPLNRSLFLEEVLRWLPELERQAGHYGLAPEIRPDFGDCRSEHERRLRLVEYLKQDPPTIPGAEMELGADLLEQPVYRQLAVRIWQWRNRPRPGIIIPESYREPIERQFGAEAPIGITALEEYRLCPYRFFLRYCLKIKPPAEPDPVPDHLDLGTLYHDVLKDFCNSELGRAWTPERMPEYRSRLEGLFQNRFAEWQRKAPNDLIRAMLLIYGEQANRTLRQWLAAELQWAGLTKSRFRPRLLEHEFGPTAPYRLEWDGVTARIVGRIDRVDTDTAGNFIVYDYKLGNGPAVNDLMEIKKLQIPVYLLALEQLLEGPGTAIGGSYLGLRNPSRYRGGVWRRSQIDWDRKGKGILDDNGWEQWLSEVKGELAAIARGIRAGRFPLTIEDCPRYCEFRSGCRRRDWEEATADGSSAQ
jgi:ATP-dependent helicase/DNAse subunit B